MFVSTSIIKPTVQAYWCYLNNLVPFSKTNYPIWPFLEPSGFSFLQHQVSHGAIFLWPRASVSISWVGINQFSHTLGLTLVWHWVWCGGGSHLALSPSEDAHGLLAVPSLSSKAARSWWGMLPRVSPRSFFSAVLWRLSCTLAFQPFDLGVVFLESILLRTS